MVDPNRVKPVLNDIQTFHDEQLGRHKLNFKANWVMVILALASTLGTVIGGILNWPHKAIALIGIAGTAIVALQAALAIEDKAEFERSLVSDAENLLLYLRDPELTEENFVKYRDQFATIRSEGSKKLPRGGGVAAARKLPPVETPT